jgi:hypothetical protein
MSRSRLFIVASRLQSIIDQELEDKEAARAKADACISIYQQYPLAEIKRKSPALQAAWDYGQRMIELLYKEGD